MLRVVTLVELLYWDGCPSHPVALAELRAALAEVGRPEIEVTMTEIATEAQARERAFIGSPTVRIAGVDVLPPDPDEPTGLTCRIYRRRDGRYSPTPDPLDVRDGLRRLLPPSAKEE
jgi:hypothetical protein